jgi:hypothetical protein
MTPEGKLTNFCLDLFNHMPDAYMQKRLAGMARSGEPDLTGILNKKRIEIEMKYEQNKPTKLQLLSLQRWNDLGAITGWANSIIAFIKIFEKELNQDQILSIYNSLKNNKLNRTFKYQIQESIDFLLDTRHDILRKYV